MKFRLKCNKFFSCIVVLNYYLASILLLVAGFIKIVNPAVSDLLQTISELEILNFELILAISRIQPWLEIVVGIIAIFGWRPELIAKGMACVYLFFSGLILYVSQGYLLLPIDCGCFGEGDGVPAYLLLIRNITIAILLLFFTRAYRKWAFFYRLSGTWEHQ